MSTAAIIAICTSVYSLASEIIGLNKKWKSNSVVQVVMGVLGSIFGKK